jgi:hypothetical protein
MADEICSPASTPNDDSLIWYGDIAPGGCGAPLRTSCYPAPSGCNYSIELKVWDQVAYSGYFTIINPDDSGLEPNALCPGAGSQVGPMNETCE